MSLWAVGQIAVMGLQIEESKHRALTLCHVRDRLVK